MTEIRSVLRPLIGKRVTLNGIVAEIHPRRIKRNVVIKDVKLMDGRHVAGHLWIKLAKITPEMILGRIVFAGTVVKYQKLNRNGFYSENYGIEGVRAKKK